MDGLIVDNFAGGGGASSGIELALGRPVDIAINHDPEAVAMHRANHPTTEHLCQNVWQIDPDDIERQRCEASGDPQPSTFKLEPGDILVIRRTPRTE